MADGIKTLKGWKILVQGNVLGKIVSRIVAQAEGYLVHDITLRRKVEKLIAPHFILINRCHKQHFQVYE